MLSKYLLEAYHFMTRLSRVNRSTKDGNILRKLLDIRANCAIILNVRRRVLRERYLGVAQLGSVLEWGSRGRRFESSHPDVERRFDASHQIGVFHCYSESLPEYEDFLPRMKPFARLLILICGINVETTVSFTRHGRPFMDKETFTALVQRQQRQLYRIAVSYTASSADAEDAVQEALLLSF